MNPTDPNLAHTPVPATPVTSPSPVPQINTTPLTNPMPGEPTAPVNAGAPVNSPTDASPVPANKAPIYRQYWVFGAIYLILPMIIGLIILLTGDIYRMKNSVATPISKKEKMVLTVIAIILQLGAISRR